MIIADESQLVEHVARLQAAGEKVVFTNGVFDILHVGHLRYLQEARRQGDHLLVALNSDASVRRIKGPTRPIVAEDERAELINALRCVDLVTIFGTDTPVPLVASVRPAIYVKGGDYTIERLPESPVVHSYGGEVRILQFVPGKSTTNIIESVIRSFAARGRNEQIEEEIKQSAK
jgi:rfaE bifunctional protein nucleotidyltransferase chain/domain